MLGNAVDRSFDSFQLMCAHQQWALFILGRTQDPAQHGGAERLAGRGQRSIAEAGECHTCVFRGMLFLAGLPWQASPPSRRG
jgi:hypothetical protein